MGSGVQGNRGSHTFFRARASQWLAAGICVLAIASTGCSLESSKPSGEKRDSAAEPLSAITLRTYGFESLSDWSAAFSTPTLSLSTTRLEGSFSLSVAGGGWSSFKSRALAKEDPAPSVVGFDLLIPSPQPNPSWFGTVILFVSIPSQGVNEVPLGNRDLIAWTPGQWKRAEFTLPTSVRNALNANFANDLQWRIELNRPVEATAGYLFDHFTYGPCAPISDGNPCTTDSCGAQGQQVHTPVSAGTSCSDGNACNGAETCNATGTCVAGTPVVCMASDQCHNAGTCNTTTGVCSNPAKTNGTACSDGNACTQTDTCQSGTCSGGNAVVCTASDQCHNVGTCNTTTGVCSNPAKTNGTACNDGNACTQSDTCQSGACSAGNAVVCTASDQCHNAGTCSPSTGMCSNPAKPNGSTCTDQNACTQPDTCQSGTCSPGAPLPVDDANPCTADACSPMGGVTHVPVPAGTSCEDQNPWNGAETCDGAGHCQPGTPVTCIPTGTRDTAVGSQEECDDGSGSEPDLCSLTCRVTDALAVRGGSQGARRYLGESRHPVSAGSRGFGVAFVEPDSNPPEVGLAVFDSDGDPRARIALGEGSVPVLSSSPAVAALDDGSYAVAWTDFGRDGDGLGIAMRRVRPVSSSGASPPVSGADLGATLSRLQFADNSSAFSQYDPDVLRVGNRLIVAWVDTSNAFTAPDVRFREFDVGTSGSQGPFTAVGPAEYLTLRDALEGSVALAPFAQSWVAAWRISEDNGEELISVTMPSTGHGWTIGPHAPGASEDRPAVVELDSTHLGVLYSVGTDPEATGTASVPRLRFAVLTLGTLDPPAVFDFLPDEEAYADPAIGQSHPSLVRAGGVLYAAWRSATLFGDPEGENVFLRELTWNGAIGATPEYRIPRAASASSFDQRFPALAVGPPALGTPALPDPAPQGSLVVAWDDYGREFGSIQGRPDVVVQFWPLPVLRFDQAQVGP